MRKARGTRDPELEELRVDDELEQAYKAMAEDQDREAEALEWADNLAPEAIVE